MTNVMTGSMVGGMKYLLRLSADQTGTVIDGDTLNRFIHASQSEGDEAFGLPELARYVGARLQELLDSEG